MRVVALISGGKDSMLAAHKVAEEHELTGLLGIIPARSDSYMFHTVNLHMLDVIAECMELPITKIDVSGEEELEVTELAEKLDSIDADAICIGGIESEYQRKRFEKVCRASGLEMLAPLWGMDVEEIMREVVNRFDVMIVSVSAMGLDESFLGRRIDEKCLEDLRELNRKYRIHLAGEGGEYETLVLDAPLYRKRIIVDRIEKWWDGMRGYCKVTEFTTVAKPISYFSKVKNGKI